MKAGVLAASELQEWLPEQGTAGVHLRQISSIGDAALALNCDNDWGKLQWAHWLGKVAELVASLRHGLAARRRSLGYSQERLADAVGVERTTVARWERGETCPQPWSRPKIAKVLDVSVEQLDAMLALHGEAGSDLSPSCGNQEQSALLGVQPSAQRFNDVLSPDDEERILLAVRKPSRLDVRIADSLATILGGQRQSEDVIGSGPLIRPVVAQLAMIEHLVIEARGPLRSTVLDVASQWAEYAGWLHTSTGHPPEAHAWFDRAVEWASECGNNTMVATAFSFKGHLAYLLGQIPSMVSLTQAAQRVGSVWVGQRAYDAYQKARALALLGNSEAAARKIGEGRELAALTHEKRGETPPWIYYYTAPFYALERALVYRYLGRGDAALNQEAITSFTAALNDLGNERSSEWAAEYIYHLAIAYMQAGAPDKTCETAMEVFAIARSTQSERLVKRTCDIYACLARRWPGDSNVGLLGEALRSADSQRYLIFT